MKIYIAKTSSGIYEDYRERIEKVFIDDIKANQFKEDYNKNLAERRIKVEKCCDCKCRYSLKGRKPKCFKMSEDKCCADKEDYSTLEEWNAVVEEYEVEE